VILPPPPAAPAPGAPPTLLPIGGQGTNPAAPTVPTGTVISTPTGPAVTTAGGGLTPLPTTPSGAGGTALTTTGGGSGYAPSGGGGSSGGAAPYNPAQTTPNAPAALAPVAGGLGLSAPITLPLVGDVPTWGVLLALAGGGYLLWKRGKRSA